MTAPKRLRLLSLALLTSLALLALTPAATALAQQETVFVLGIRSLEGDDDLARSLSGEIRASAGEVPSWDAQPQEITLAQMTMVHSCEEPDAPCMRLIAEELSADKIIYATLRRTSAAEDHDYVLSLYLFDTAEGRIMDQITDTIPRSARGVSAIRERADRYVAQLGGLTRFGTLRVDAGEPSAEVFVDGSSVGVTDDGGFLTVEDLSEGTHRLQVQADGFQEFSSNVSVPADGIQNVRTQLVREGESVGPDLRWVPGVAATAVGLSLILGAIPASQNVNDYRSQREALESMRSEDGTVQLDTAQQMAYAQFQQSGARPSDGALTDFQVMLLSAGADGSACDGELAQEWMQTVCDEQAAAVRRHRALYITGGVLTGAGVALLIWWAVSRESDEEESAVNVQISPYLSHQDGGANLQLTW